MGGAQGAVVLKGEWRTDEQRARDEAYSWKVELEAWLLGLAMLAVAGHVIGALF